MSSPLNFPDEKSVIPHSVFKLPMGKKKGGGGSIAVLFRGLRGTFFVRDEKKENLIYNCDP